MSPEENVAVALRLFDDVWCGRVDEFAWWTEEIRAAFGDLKATPDRVLAADEDHVVILFTVTAVHRGNYHGIPATGQPISFRGSTLMLVENGRVVEEFAFGEKLGSVMTGGETWWDETIRQVAAAEGLHGSAEGDS